MAVFGGGFGECQAHHTGGLGDGQGLGGGDGGRIGVIARISGGDGVRADIQRVDDQRGQAIFGNGGTDRRIAVKKLHAARGQAGREGGCERDIAGP